MTGTFPAPRARRCRPTGEVVLGEDTHQDAHVAAALSLVGAVIGTGDWDADGVVDGGSFDDVAKLAVYVVDWTPDTMPLLFEGITGDHRDHRAAAKLGVIPVRRARCRASRHWTHPNTWSRSKPPPSSTERVFFARELSGALPRAFTDAPARPGPGRRGPGRRGPVDGVRVGGG